jgi:hypothetical protein
MPFENAGRASEVTQFKAQPGLVALCLSPVSLAQSSMRANQRNEIAPLHSHPRLGEYVDQSRKPLLAEPLVIRRVAAFEHLGRRRTAAIRRLSGFDDGAQRVAVIRIAGQRPGVWRCCCERI